MESQQQMVENHMVLLHMHTDCCIHHSICNPLAENCQKKNISGDPFAWIHDFSSTASLQHWHDRLSCLDRRTECLNCWHHLYLLYLTPGNSSLCPLLDHKESHGVYLECQRPFKRQLYKIQLYKSRACRSTQGTVGGPLCQFWHDAWQTIALEYFSFHFQGKCMQLPAIHIQIIEITCYMHQWISKYKSFWRALFVLLKFVD